MAHEGAAAQDQEEAQAAVSADHPCLDACCCDLGGVRGVSVNGRRAGGELFWGLPNPSIGLACVSDDGKAADVDSRVRRRLFVRACCAA